MSWLLTPLVDGLARGAIYTILALGLLLILQRFRILNFAHAAQYIWGGFVTLILVNQLGEPGLWSAPVVAPLLVGLLGAAIAWLMLRPSYELEHHQALLLTLGLALLAEGFWVLAFGGQPLRSPIPAALRGNWDLGLVVVPIYRACVIVFSLFLCLIMSLLAPRLRLAIPPPQGDLDHVRSGPLTFGTPPMIPITYGIAAALAALAGVLGTPFFGLHSLVGVDLIVPTFAVLVIAGTHSVFATSLTAFVIGLVEALTRSAIPGIGRSVVFIIMALVLLVRPAGIFGPSERADALGPPPAPTPGTRSTPPFPILRVSRVAKILATLPLLLLLFVAPFLLAPLLLTELLCMGLFTYAFAFFFRQTGRVSLGHAAFLGSAGYAAGYAAKVWATRPELAILFGTLVAAALAAAIGSLALRASGLLFPVVTLGLAEVVYEVWPRDSPWEPIDLTQVPRGTLLGLLDLSDPRAMYYVALTICIVAFLAIWRSETHWLGAQPAVAERSARRALCAFVLSAGIAGIAGTIKTLAVGVAFSSNASWHTSVEVALVTFVCGARSRVGPVLGALFMFLFEPYVAAPLGISLPKGILAGPLLVLCVLTFKRGVVGELMYLRRGSA